MAICSQPQLLEVVGGLSQNPGGFSEFLEDEGWQRNSLLDYQTVWTTSLLRDGMVGREHHLQTGSLLPIALSYGKGNRRAFPMEIPDPASEWSSMAC